MQFVKNPQNRIGLNVEVDVVTQFGSTKKLLILASFTCHRQDNQNFKDENGLQSILIKTGTIIANHALERLY